MRKGRGMKEDIAPQHLETCPIQGRGATGVCVMREVIVWCASGLC